jgi:hypothetical protein
MSDKDLVLRDAKGRVLEGSVLGRKGGRKPIPDWFKDYSEKALRVLADIIDGNTDADIKLKQATAVEVINRLHGKVDSKMEVAVGVDAAGGTCLQVSFVAADKKTSDDEV